MISLPLYRDTRAAVETAARVETTSGHNECRRCSRYKGASSVCIQPEIIDQGDGPTLLLVGERPGAHEDRAGRPFVGRAGQLLRSVVKDWKGKVVLDNALRCYSDKKLNKKDLHHSTEKCRGYSHDTIELAKPERIIALGSIASLSLLGRPSIPYSVRKSYAWLSDGTPVFLGINPAAGLRNRFVARWFEEDLRWAMACDLPVPTHWDSEFSIVRTSEDARFAAHTLREAKWFGFDIENSGVFGDEYYRVLCLAACPGGTDAPFVWDEQALNDPATADPLFDLLEDPLIKKTGHNVKHDMLAMRFGHGVLVRGIWADSMLDRRIAQSDAKAGLSISSELVGMGGLKAEAERALAVAVASIGKARKEHKALLKSGTQGKLMLPGLTDPGIDSAVGAACRLIDVAPKAFAYALLPYDVLVRYCALDSIATTRLTEVQRIGFLGATRGSTREECDRLAETIRWTPRAIKLSRDFMTQAVEAYEAIEAWGIGANVQAIDDFKDYLVQKKREAIDAVHAVSEIDPGSRDEVERFVYDKLGISCSHDERTETGKRGTGKEILQRLRDKNPEHSLIINSILEYRRVDKLLGTYTDGFKRFIRSDRRIHPNFKLAGTDAGRPSCEDPNMQTLARPGTTEGKMSRDCFDADVGYVLVEGDYSQIELRCAGMLSGDRRMIEAFINDEDLHWKTTRIIAKPAWGISSEDIDESKHKKNRSDSKAVTFGLMYGKQARTLAKELGIPVARAEIIIQSILGGYPDYAEWREDQVMHARRYGEIFTYWDGKPLRRRPLWPIGDVGREDSARAVTAKNGAYNCLDSETEALTKRGWVKGFDLLMSDEILTKNPNTGVLEWQCPTDLKFWPDYSGDLIEFTSKSFHAITTPDHRWLVNDKHSGGWRVRTSKNISRYGDHRIHRTGEYLGSQKQHDDDFVWLAGWFLTDGFKGKSAKPWYPGKRGPKPGTPQSGLCQSKEPHRSEIDYRFKCLLRDGKISNPGHHEGRHGQWTWLFRGAYSAKLWELFPERELTLDFMLQLTPNQLRILRETMMDGDGTRDIARNKDVFYAGKRGQAEAFQILLTLTGAHGYCSWRDMSMYEPISDKLDNIPKTDGCWQVNIARRDTVQIQRDHVREYKGCVGVWCPVVPNTFFVARRDNRVWITGNTPVQGTASDFCLRSAIAGVQACKSGHLRDCRLIWTIHDSNIYEVPEDDVDIVIPKIAEIMLQWPTWNGVPLKVDFKVGKRFGSMKDYELAT